MDYSGWFMVIRFCHRSAAPGLPIFNVLLGVAVADLAPTTK